MSAFQVSTVNALVLGHYEKVVAVKDVLEHGTLGLGTYEGLAGEALIIDGKAYEGQPGGKVIPADPTRGIAFCTVAPFTMAGTVFQVARIADIAALKARADEVRRVECKGDNYPCFMRVDGTFEKITVRSCRRQDQPYRPLLTVTKDQVETTAENIEGTIIGVWFPAFLDGTSIPGWHFHFISRDRSSLGGHCLACTLKGGLIGAKREMGFQIVLPSDAGFAKLDLDRDISKMVATIEGESRKRSD